MPATTVKPFKRVKVSTRLLGGTTVTWEIDRQFKETQPYAFTVQVGRNVWDDSWINVNTAPVSGISGVIITDTTQRVWSTFTDVFYRVQLVTGDATYYSTAVQADGALSTRDWRLVRAVSKREDLWHRKYGGAKGYFLKRRVWGAPCPGRLEAATNTYIPCTDFDTGSVIDTDCPTCFGTGIECGYYASVDMFVVLSQRSRDSKQHANRGTVEDVIISGRTLAWPEASQDDVWIQDDSDARYYVQKIQNTSEFRGVPIIQTLELRKAPASDPAYLLPRTGTPCTTVPGSGYGGGYAYI